MKMTRLGKIKTAAEDYLNQYKSTSPASYAAAQQAIGGVLIVDGFIGIDNPFGENKRSGIFGSLLGIVIGFVFLFAPTIFDKFTGVDKMTAQTQATVVSVREDNTGEDSGSSCTAKAKYVVDGKEYEQNSSFGSGTYCSLSPGSTIDINYNPNQPGSWGYNLQSLANFMKIFSIAGVVIIITSFVTFMIRLLSIYFGWKLLKSGRALARTLPSGTDLESLKNEIKKNFASQLFNFGASVPPAQPQAQGSVANPQIPPPTVPPVQPPQQPVTTPPNSQPPTPVPTPPSTPSDPEQIIAPSSPPLQANTPPAPQPPQPQVPQQPNSPIPPENQGAKPPADSENVTPKV